MGLDFQEQTQNYINNLTKSAGGLSILKDQINRWKTEMKFTEIANIQRDCKDALAMWRYVSFKNVDEISEISSFFKLNKL